MTRLNAFLVVMLLGCALSLVTAQYKERRLFVDLERAEADAKKIDVAWNQLQIDQTTYSQHSLIDAAARRDLHMFAVTPARTEYMTLTLPDTASAAPSSVEPAGGKK